MKIESYKTEKLKVEKDLNEMTKKERLDKLDKSSFIHFNNGIIILRIFQKNRYFLCFCSSFNN